MIEDYDVESSRPANFHALLPFFVFMVFYLGLSILANDFYKVPMPVAFIVASAFAMLQNRKAKLTDKVEVFAKGMGDTNIMIMCLIFILAGAFATIAKQMHAVDAAVVIARNLIPARFMVIGIFIVSCFISLAVGTSCGTIAALTPIAVGLIGPLGISPEMMISAVIGGSMFGDNLSMISDTTIAATRTQGVSMRDKFFTNLKIVIPAMIVTLILYFCLTGKINPATVGGDVEPIAMKHVILVMPYVMILVCALCGMNVMMLLFCGAVIAGIIGIWDGAFDFWGALSASGAGSLGMAETLFVALLAGGLLKIIRWNGGIAWLLKSIQRSVSTPRGCEFGIMLLLCVVNMFTANNTVAIVIAGPIAKTMSDRYNCDPRRIASILDTSSCVVQGAIAYGAQILIAAGLAKEAGVDVAPLSLVSSLYYPMFLAVSLVANIAIRKNHNNVIDK